MNKKIKELTGKVKNELKSVISLDLRALAIFRIGIALVFIFDLTNRIKYLRTFYTNEGIVPIRNQICSFNYEVSCDDLYTLTNIERTFSLNLISGDFYFQLLLFLISFALAFSLLVGYKTRIVTILCWILLVSIQNRNPIILQGGDTLIRMAYFWAIFLPLGAKFSIDAFKQKLKYGKTKFENKIKETSIPAIAIILQICIIYFFAALLKDDPEWHTNYNAAWFAINLETFNTFVGEWVGQHYELTRFMTFMAYYIELFVAAFILFPIKNWFFRGIGIIALIVMHLGFAATLHLGIFAYAAISLILVLLPTELIDSLKLQLSKLFKIKHKELIYNPKLRSHRKTYSFFSTLGLLQNFTFEESTKAKSLVLKIEDKKFETDQISDIFKSIFKSSLYLRFFTLIFKSKIISNKINKLEEKTIKLDGFEDSSHFNKKDFKNFTIYILSSFLAGFSLSLVLLWNYGDIVEKSHVNGNYREYVRFFRLDQKWNMFAPKAFKNDGWNVVYGYTEDGREYHLFGDSKSEKYERPDDISDEYDSQRWRKFLNNLLDDDYAQYRSLYLYYECRKWNEKNSNKLERIELEYVQERIVLPWETKSQFIRPLSQINCEI